MKYKIINFVVMVLFFIGCTLFYTLVEQWTVVDAVLFIVSTITTVGKRIKCCSVAPHEILYNLFPLAIGIAL